MKTLLAILLFLVSSAAIATTENVTVHWTPTNQPVGVTVAHYVIYYTDSTGTN